MADTVMRWLLILFALPLAAQITCSPSNCVVPSGGNLTVSSPTPVTWSLCSGCVGSLSTAGPSTSTVYTAPTGVVPSNQMLGCPVLPNDSIFNLRVDALPLDSNSTTKITNMEIGSFVGLNFQPSWGVSQANSSTPTRTVKTFYGSNTYTIPQPTGAALQRESGNLNGIWGWFASGNNGNSADHHQMIVDYSNCSFAETYNDYINGAQAICQDSTSGCTAQSAASYSGVGYPIIASGTDAAGLPLAPLTLTDTDMREAATGKPLGHKLRYTDAGNHWVGESSLSQVWIWPATGNASGCYPGSSCSPAATFGANGESTNYLSLGNDIRLKASFTTTGLCNADTGSPSSLCSITNICGALATSTQQAMCTNLLTGIQQQGLIPADSGSVFAVTPAADIQQDPDAVAVLTAIQNANISRSNFEVVDTVGSGIFYSPTSYQVTPSGSAGSSAVYGGITYAGATQSSVTPNAQAVVIGGSNKISAAVQSVAIGSSLPPFLGFIQAGHPGIPMPAYTWVNPSTVSQSITWSVIGSGCGSFTGSTYIPPATAASVVLGCDLHGVAVADTAAVYDQMFNLFPNGTAVRIDTGSATTTTDGASNTWQAETGIQNSHSNQTGTLSAWPSGNTWRTQYNTQQAGYAGDLGYSGFVVPGNYKLHILEGQADAFCSVPCGSWPGSRSFTTLAFNPLNIDVNSVTVAHNWQWPWSAGFVYDTPADIYVPAASDANGYITFATRVNVPDTSYSGSYTATSPYTGPNLAPPSGPKWQLFGGFELTQDSTPAFLSIDLNAGGQPSGCTIIPTGLACAAGTALQPLYAVNHYISGFVPTSTTWAIVIPGVGNCTSSCNVAGLTGNSITTNADGSGSLTLGSGSPLAGQPIVVQATNGSKTATAAILTSGSRWLLNAK